MLDHLAGTGPIISIDIYCTCPLIYFLQGRHVRRQRERNNVQHPSGTETHHLDLRQMIMMMTVLSRSSRDYFSDPCIIF